MFWNRKKGKTTDNTSESTALMIHQLRTPLTAIRLTHQLLLEEDGTSLTKKQRYLLTQAREQSDQLYEMIHNLLRTSIQKDVAANKMHCIEDVIEDTIHQIEIQTKQKQQKITKAYAKICKPALFNYEQMKIAFTNIIENASIYTPKKGSITVGTAYTDTGCIVTVSDTGIGVPEDDIPELFQKYGRMDNAKKVHPDGTGLGLYIAKQIVEELGGTISYARNKQQGSVFTITLPLGV